MSQHTTIETTSVTSGWNYTVYINHEHHSDGAALSTAERIVGGWAATESKAKSKAKAVIDE